MTSGHIEPLSIWITGLSGSDKTSIATTLQIKLKEQGIPSVHVDGNKAEKLISSDLKFLKVNRMENKRLIANIGKYFI